MYGSYTTRYIRFLVTKVWPIYWESFITSYHYSPLLQLHLSQVLIFKAKHDSLIWSLRLFLKENIIQNIMQLGDSLLFYEKQEGHSNLNSV